MNKITIINISQIVFILLLFNSPLYSQKTYFVSNKGNDNNSGLSEIFPFKTIEKLIIKTPKPFDTIKLERGSIWHESLFLTKDTVKNWRDLYDKNMVSNITIEAYGVGENPILDGSDIMDSNWNKYKLNSNVYYRKLFIGTKDDMQRPGVWDNFIVNGKQSHLRKRASIELVNENPGSFYYSIADSLLYVSTYERSEPKDKQISVSMRNDCIFIGDSAHINGITTKRNLYNDGSLLVGKNSIVENSNILDGTKHNILIGSGKIINCNISGQGFVDDYGGIYSAIGYFFKSNNSEIAQLINITSSYEWEGPNANATLLTAHANNGGNFKLVELDNVYAKGYGGIYGNTPKKIIQKNSTFIDCRTVYSGGVDTLISVSNKFIKTDSCKWGFIVPFEIFYSASNIFSTNDLFKGSPNTGQGFFDINEGGGGSSINIYNPRIIYTDISVAESAIRFISNGKLRLEGAGIFNQSEYTFNIMAKNNIEFNLNLNYYQNNRFFMLDDGYKTFESWKKNINSDLSSKLYTSSISNNFNDFDTGPRMLITNQNEYVIKTIAVANSDIYRKNDYIFNVPNDITEIKYIPAIEDKDQKVYINNKEVINYTDGLLVNLNVGINKIRIEVKKQSTIFSYLINVKRLSNNTNIIKFEIKNPSIQLLPKFNTNTTLYTGKINFKNDYIKFVILPEDSNSKIFINKNKLQDTSRYKCSVGKNLFNVKIIAEDNSYQEYIIDIIRDTNSKAYFIKKYPNPSNGKFFLEIQTKTDNIKNLEIMVITINGNVIIPNKKYDLINKNIIIPFDLSVFQKGIYIIYMILNNERISLIELIE